MSPQKDPGTSHLLKGLLRSHPYALIALILLSILGTLFSLATPLMMGFLIDKVLMGGNTGLLLPILLGMAVLFGVSALSDYVSNTLRGKLNLLLFRELTNDLFGSVQKASLIDLQQMKTGDLLTRTMGNTNVAVQTVTSTIPQIVVTVAGFILPFLIMFSLNPKLAVIASSPVILFVISSAYYGNRIRKYQRRSLDSAAGMNSFLKEAYTIVPLTKVFILEEWIHRKFDAHMAKYMDSSWDSVRISSMNSALGLAIYGIPTLLVLTFGSMEVISGSMSVGTLTAFIGYTGLFFSPVQLLSALWTNYRSSLASIDRIREVFSLRKESWGENRLPDSIEKIEFQDVGFSYGTRRILSGFDATFRRGRNYLVGDNGSGKTTLIQILCGFYIPDKGAILINGQNLGSLSGDSLRNAVSVVFSDLQVFDGTIYENILIGDLSASREAVISAAVKAELQDFVTRLPNGYETEVGESGLNLSSGEKQKIALARVILRDTPVIIFDEFTRSIDADSKRSIYSAIRQLEDKIIIIITHDMHDIEEGANVVTMAHHSGPAATEVQAEPGSTEPLAVLAN
jgi:ATP-binding cassette subfamily B protein/subfamily B ATP-binding cassette protein MsbA